MSSPLKPLLSLTLGACLLAGGLSAFLAGRIHGDMAPIGGGYTTVGQPSAAGTGTQGGPWIDPEAAAEREMERVRLGVERALYAQGDLLREALAGIAAGDPATLDMYLLAVGGDGTQEVFRREVEYIRAQFDRDFGTAGRSLVLVNSRSRLDTAPMATVHSLGEAIETIAARMDAQQDILFLYLTSHGSRAHELVLDQDGMALRWLPAAMLAELLKESGIKWKLVVVSACYSGGFIEPLKDPHTLIITASRADRSSFGCADENDFTYFGRAFFEQALPQTSSIPAAFEKAAELVREWEAEEYPHSEPQMDSPPAIVEQLRLWRAQLPARP